MISKFPPLLAAMLAAGAAWAQPGKIKAAGDEAPGIAGAGYDGVWNFESTTTAGNCPTLVPVSVVVEKGLVVSANNGASTPWGYVETDGTFVARFTDANGHVSRANGRFAGGGGSGAWSSGTDYCGGAWRAHRGAGGKAAR
ncbi:MAG: hypothetical protein WB816_17915 [Methylocystis sp.]